MEIFKSKLNIDFVGKRYIAFAISGICILATVVLLAVSYTHLTLPTKRIV